MAIEIASLLKKGFTPIVANRYAAVSWQGEALRDFWMWNGQVSVGPRGRSIQTVKVSDLKEASVRLWRDRWVPLRWDRALLRRMEESLRRHAGLKKQGVVFPDTPFLPDPATIPSDCVTPEIEEFMSNGGVK
ncbi:MAG: hypothetical protein IT362_04125 [Deltaproteobacteria bacterium]|nr:hypothetical protein [Deltaproteobacteria bacterium]